VLTLVISGYFRLLGEKRKRRKEKITITHYE
jgi:hypothetical protein